MRTATRTLLILLLALAAMPLAAQDNKPNIGQVMIEVKDLASKEIIATVEPGGTLTLPSGSHVRLIMTAIPAGAGRRTLYPATTFSDTSNGGVTITRSNAENSTADLVLNRGKAAPGRTETIRYQIQETWVPAGLRTGSFRIHIAPASSLQGNVDSGISLGNSNAEQLTRMLYQAILLRDLDTGAAGTIDSIASGGYDALVQAAVGIANSEESRIRLYEQGTTNEQRLAALYRHLLGVSTSQIDRGQYNSDLQQINAGRIANVVAEIVSSDRFRDRIGLVRY